VFIKKTIVTRVKLNYVVVWYSTVHMFIYISQNSKNYGSYGLALLLLYLSMV